MKPIEELFKVHRAKSGLFTDYQPGAVAYVGNSLNNNAVVGFVTPLKTDRVFNFRGIAVSAFCEASIQVPPFVACGRAGNGLVVLEPRVPMSSGELAWFAAYINHSLRWRFNWYRQITADRIRNLPVPDRAPSSAVFPVLAALPPLQTPVGREAWDLSLGRFSLGSLFDLKSGDYHVMSELSPGETPMVSCGDENNGVAGYFEVTKTHRNRLTIALNGSTLSTKFHPYTFAAKDDVAVCIPRQPLRVTTLLFIQVMLNRERWRYSYYRKCYTDKLRRFEVSLPETAGRLDEGAMERVMHGVPYWEYLARRLAPD